MTVIIIFLPHLLPNILKWLFSVNIERWHDMTCAEYSEYIILLSTFWIKIFNFHIFLYPLKYVPDPCDVKMDRNKQRHLQRRTPMIYYVTGFFKHSKSWNKNKDIYDQSSPRFSHCKKCIYNTAQIDVGFGQVHIVWWLSYSQVGEKISVESCVVSSCHTYCGPFGHTWVCSLPLYTL